jgi:hypothetical protein
MLYPELRMGRDPRRLNTESKRVGKETSSVVITFVGQLTMKGVVNCPPFLYLFNREIRLKDCISFGPTTHCGRCCLYGQPTHVAPPRRRRALSALNPTSRESIHTQAHLICEDTSARFLRFAVPPAMALTRTPTERAPRTASASPGANRRAIRPSLDHALPLLLRRVRFWCLAAVAAEEGRTCVVESRLTVTGRDCSPLVRDRMTVRPTGI